MKWFLFLAMAIGLNFGFSCVSSCAETESAEQSEAAELAKKTQNPVANLISVPIQFNWDYNIGPAKATKTTVNVQPVIPVSINKDLNLITRTILPILHVQSPVPGEEDQNGIGDVLQSFFLSPTKLVRGWVVGAGPVFLYPTASKDSLGSEKWGAGPTAVVLKQKHGWTMGFLGNHVWSVAGASDRSEVNSTFLQPFIGKTSKTYTTLNVNTESTYNWVLRQWTVPVNFQLSQLLKVGNFPFSITFGYRYYASKPDGGPDSGLRAVFTALFPK